MEYKDLGAADLADFVDYDDHYKVRFFEDEASGLRAYIAVHNINRGPALGGCRFYDYESDADAIRDVLRLSRGMTYKNALAGLPLGGGKSVIIGNPKTQKTDALLEAMGAAVDTLDGDYITAEDSGTCVADMEVIHRNTDHVMGLTHEGSELGGDPSPHTAYGVFCGIRAALRRKYGSVDMNGLKVAIQGLGAVGYDVARQLDEQGAELFVTDVNEAVLEKAKAAFKNVHVVGLDEIFGVDAQVLAPCALGAQINAQTIPQLKVDIVAGAANNQMETADDHQRLADRGILYAPDYVINAAGVIAVCYEYLEQVGKNPLGHDLTVANMVKHVEQIEATLEKIFNISEAKNIPPGLAADELAEAIFNAAHAENKSSGAAS